jgi:hypothetical protein
MSDRESIDALNVVALVCRQSGHLENPKNRVGLPICVAVDVIAATGTFPNGTLIIGMKAPITTETCALEPPPRQRTTTLPTIPG